MESLQKVRNIYILATLRQSRQMYWSGIARHLPPDAPFIFLQKCGAKYVVVAERPLIVVCHAGDGV